MLFIFGAEECAGPQVLPVCGAARKGLTEAGYAHVRVETIEGANHGYVGREQVLYTTIGDFLAGTWAEDGGAPLRVSGTPPSPQAHPSRASG